MGDIRNDFVDSHLEGLTWRVGAAKFWLYFQTCGMMSNGRTSASTRRSLNYCPAFERPTRTATSKHLGTSTDLPSGALDRRQRICGMRLGSHFTNICSIATELFGKSLSSGFPHRSWKAAGAFGNCA